MNHRAAVMLADFSGEKIISDLYVSEFQGFQNGEKLQKGCHFLKKNLANHNFSKTLRWISYLCFTATFRDNHERGEIRKLVSCFVTNTLEERNLREHWTSNEN
jgi:hypothetical protein